MTSKLLLVIAAAMTLAACNTVAGAGKDVSAAGTAVTSTADTAEKKM
ncbi:MAG: entericidin A/B family lipoprotein [Amaricoccus sp.]